MAKNFFGEKLTFSRGSVALFGLGLMLLGLAERGRRRKALATIFDVVGVGGALDAGDIQTATGNGTGSANGEPSDSARGDQ